MKRFWDRAEVAEVVGGFSITLDGRPMRLPGAGSLTLPNRALADAVAEEWGAAGGAKGGEMSLEDVPLTRLAATAVDRIAPDPAPTVREISRYGESDLLCYRATDRVLAAQQAAEWDPLLNWCDARHGARLRSTTGIMHLAQDPAALQALHRVVGGFVPLELAALGIVVPATGSLVLGLALADGQIDAVAAHRLATLDETHQESLWGEDAEALARRERMAAEVALAARLLSLAHAA
ncbi:ATP12 family chaperone protein [Roseomonas elaeocarpi]|uniref:ATP12 family chaperone protein n=1 Tax=Roseomonas elaeocarpi TaxID=907779 RepID=A0ABV6JTJ8_9PROT